MIISVSNQKGGVGKSTTVHSLAAGLSDRGKRVLAVDLDPQGNLSYSACDGLSEFTIYDALKGAASLERAITSCGGADFAASDIRLCDADMEFAHTGREYMLKELLGEARRRYEYIVIDTPPTLGILTVNAFAASDTIVVPLGADAFSLRGVELLSQTVERVKKYCNPALNVAGLLLTRFNERTNLNREMRDIIKAYAAQLGTKLFNTYIRESTSIREAQANKRDIFTYAPKSNPANDYNAFIDELLSTRILLKHAEKN